MTNRNATDSREAPLTPSQTLFWKGHQLSPDAPIYNTAWQFHLHFDLDYAIFAQAFQDVVSASDAMCSVICESDNGTVQRLISELTDFPEPLDLTQDPEPESALSAWFRDWIAEPFDLGKCTYRTRLIKLNSQHWVWAFAQHHIACDAQSGANLLEAVSDRYLQIVTKQDAEPVSVPPYFDLVGEWANLPAPEQQEISKRAAFSEVSLPYGAVRSGDHASVRVDIPIADDLGDALLSFTAKPENQLFTPSLTQFASYLSAFVAFLYRVTDDDSITVGVPSHNRLSRRDREVLGLFVEVLPVEFIIDAEETFQSLYHKVREAIFDFLQHAKPNAVLAVSPGVVSGVLNFVQVKFPDFAGNPVEVEMCHAGAHDAGHGLRLHVTDFDGTGRSLLAMDINKDILQHTEAERVASHFTSVLTALASNVDARISEIELCTADEVEEIRKFCVGGPEEDDADRLILDLFEEQVALRPGQPAIVCGSDTLSYAELDASSNEFAAHIVSQGIGTGSLVAVNMRRSPELIVVLMGIIKSGAAFVPIASNTATGRCRDIISLSRSRAVVADEDCAQRLQGIDIPVIPPGSRGDAAQYAPCEITCAETAYVLFTSGSTGVPKGVVVDHRGLARYINWASVEFAGAGPADYALFSSISFDLTITSIFAPLKCGGRIVVYPERSDPDLAVLDVFADDRAEIVKLTPSHLTLVCQSELRVSKIRSLVLGGENLTTHLCRETLEKVSPTLKIINEYGPTEAVVGCMSHFFDRDTDTRSSVPIGRPANGMTISVRDAGRNLVPFGLKGEICIGGRLSLGYLGQELLTSEKFVSDPHAPTEVIYRTGDVGKLRQDGVFEYLGRSDRQVKVNGVRIELAEIEAALLSAPGVTAAYVATSGSGNQDSKDLKTCSRCGIKDNVPGVNISQNGTCNICMQFETIGDKAQAYFHQPSVLTEKLNDAAQKSRGDYDAIMLLSGGKDSTYAAYRLAEFDKRVLALTLDNGFISESAKANIRRVTDHLDWDHRFLTTEAMNEIFVDSLRTFSNVCQGCFKTIYTLALRVARDEGIPAIVTGLSRGQFFETRLTPDLFVSSSPTTVELEDMVVRARKSYHAKDDAISHLLHTSDITDGRLLDQIEIIDLFRYIDVPVSEIYRFLQENAPWVRPDDTGRSTNCLINDVGIYVHKKREGFHNYALPYSWDVRMGHKTRDQALDELDDEIDETRVQSILQEIGFEDALEDDRKKTTIVAYAAVASDDNNADIWEHINAKLPKEMRPAHLVTVDKLPLTNNGKVDTDLLPVPKLGERKSEIAAVAPRTDLESTLVGIFEEVLKTSGIGVHDDFFDLGGDSLAAISIAIRANEAGLALPATAIFNHQTVARLAANLSSERVEVAVDKDETDDDLLELDAADLDAIRRALK